MEIKEIIYLLIYLIGYVWAYITFKRDRRYNCWTAVLIAVSFSTLSWFVVFFYYLDKIKLPKPPKWL